MLFHIKQSIELTDDGITLILAVWIHFIVMQLLFAKAPVVMSQLRDITFMDNDDSLSSEASYQLGLSGNSRAWPGGAVTVKLLLFNKFVAAP